MAWTITRNNTVFGNKAVVGLTCLADSAEQAISTGLKNIEFFSIGVESMTTTSSMHAKRNVGSTGTALAGTLGCSGFTSGDVVNFVVFGTR